MATKKAAQAEARRLRKENPNKTVNVREITKGNWGVRLSPKGERDTWVPGSYVSHSGKVVRPAKASRRKKSRG